MYYIIFIYSVLHVLLMSKTLFRSKKIVTRQDDRWILEINLLFEGREFSMTDIPIVIDESDVKVLCPGADPRTGVRFEDTVAIQDPYQFCSIFREALTDEVPKLLCDVYVGHQWCARFIDVNGKEITIDSYLTEDFIEEVSEALVDSDRFWMQIKMGATRFNDNWTISCPEMDVVYSNYHDGFAPLNSIQAQEIIRSLVPIDIFSDMEEFKGTVMKSGNSLVLKVTDQCRRMGLDIGDDVNVTLNLNTPRDNTELRVFAAQIWYPIADPDDICHRDGCDPELVKKFLDDFDVIGTVESRYFKPADFRSSFHMIFDHLNFFKCKDGSNIIVSQPYINDTKLEYAEEWARINGCTVEEHRDYSWHRPSETTLYIFRKKKRYDWVLPKVSSTVVS